MVYPNIRNATTNRKSTPRSEAVQKSLTKTSHNRIIPPMRQKAAKMHDSDSYISSLAQSVIIGIVGDSRRTKAKAKIEVVREQTIMVWIWPTRTME